MICERFCSRHQWGSHRSVVWAKSTVFPRIHLPSGVHGHPGGRYERWAVTWTENKVTETNISQLIRKIFLALLLVSGHPSSVRKDAKIRRAAISLLGIGDCALMIGSHHLKNFIIFFSPTFSLTELTPRHYWLFPVHRLLLAEEIRRPENSSSQDNYWTKILCPNGRNYSHRRSLCSRTLRCDSLARTGSVHKSLINPRSSVYLGYSCWF